MKLNMERHREKLKNRESHLSRERESVERAISRLEKIETSFGLYRAQIELAEKEKKDGFDEERYAIKRLCI